MNIESKKLVKTVSVVCLFIATSGVLFAHDGHHTNKAWEACKEKQLSDTCSYILQENMLYKGTCRAVNEALLCVRNKPIEKL
jgi:hypothetical protein